MLPTASVTSRRKNMRAMARAPMAPTKKPATSMEKLAWSRRPGRRRPMTRRVRAAPLRWRRSRPSGRARRAAAGPRARWRRRRRDRPGPPAPGCGRRCGPRPGGEDVEQGGDAGGSRNAGASASWMTRVMSWTWASGMGRRQRSKTSGRVTPGGAAAGGKRQAATSARAAATRPATLPLGGRRRAGGVGEQADARHPARRGERGSRGGAQPPGRRAASGSDGLGAGRRCGGELGRCSSGPSTKGRGETNQPRGRRRASCGSSVPGRCARRGGGGGRTPPGGRSGARRDGSARGARRGRVDRNPPQPVEHLVPQDLGLARRGRRGPAQRGERVRDEGEGAVRAGRRGSSCPQPSTSDRRARAGERRGSPACGAPTRRAGSGSARRVGPGKKVQAGVRSAVYCPGTCQKSQHEPVAGGDRGGRRDVRRGGPGAPALGREAVDDGEGSHHARQA